jgi:HPt (histidine-containing phosphotransfer) domain-containing protein
MSSEYTSLARLAAELDLDAEAVRRLVQTFLDSTETDLGELDRALRLGDAPAAARLAHHIKGAAAGLELEEIRRQAESLETQARGNALNTPQEAAAAIRSALRELHSLLPDLGPERPASPAAPSPG